MQNETFNFIKEVQVQKNINNTQLSKISGVNKGIISECLGEKSNSNKDLSFSAFNKILNALNISMYDHVESFMQYKIENTVQPFKVCKSSMKEAFKLGQFDLLPMMLSVYTHSDNSIQRHDKILEYLEELWIEHQEIRVKLKPLYELLLRSLLDMETNTSSTIAIVYYRIFLIEKIMGTTTPTQNVITGLIYNVNKLPNRMKLNSFFHLCIFNSRAKDWANLKDTASKMGKLVEWFLDHSNFALDFYGNDDPLDHPLVKYYGQSYLYKTKAEVNQKNYHLAYKSLENYKDLSWFPNLDQSGLEHVEKFKYYAEANHYLIALLEGKTDVIPNYYKFLNEHSGEMLMGVSSIVELCNRENTILENSILEKAVELIILRDDLVNHHPYYSVYRQQEEYLNLISELSKYLLCNGSISLGFDITLRFFESALLYKKDAMVIKALGLLESSKKRAIKSQIESYDKIREEVSNYEKVC